MNLEKIKIKELKPLEKNVRKHSEKQIDELVRSIKQFGQTRAIVIDENNNILIGNGLYYAFQKTEIDECECYRMTGLTEIQKKKLILTDNKVFTLGSDDYEEINNYIQEITGQGDFDIAGFDTYTLEMMTISDEDNEEMMKDYGKINNEKLVKSENKEVNETTQNVDDKVEKTVVITEKEVSEPKQERKYVVCPNCGEVIYID